MVDHVEIRAARHEDQDGVWTLVRGFATSFVPVRASFDAAFEGEIAYPRSFVGVAAALAGDIVGYVLASSHATFFANRSVAWVEELMVAEDVRRTGIGGQLMAAVEEWAQTAGGAAYVSLATRRAATFYEALGYEQSATFFRKPTP
jgi:GNAT superfamily N-acetyltransferase